MKKTLFSFIAFFLLLSTNFSQILDPIKWSFSVEKNGNEAFLISKAKIDKGWHLYSQILESDMGPVATEFTFTSQESYSLVGKNIGTSKVHKEYDKNFAMNLSYFEGEAIFKQKIKVSGADNFVVKGNVYYMVCNDEKCLPPVEEEFEFKIKGIKGDVKLNLVNSPDDNKTGEILNLTLNESQPEKGILKPIEWEFLSKKVGDSKYEIIAKAKLDKGWHIFSSVLESDMGPNATEFILKDPSLKSEIIEEGKVHEEYEKDFEMNVRFYENEVSFKRIITIDNPEAIIEGEIYYQVCNEGKCLLPTAATFKLDLAKEEVIGEKKRDNLGRCEPKKFEGKDQKGEKESLIGMFILAFLFGLTTLLTPCVFPMIPMTVSFFMKDKGKGIRNAIIFGLSIIIIYTFIGTLVSLLFGAEFSNWLATHWFPNVLFFLVFVFFAASFFGMFEITLPSWIVSKADKGADRGGLLGVFFMALTLVVVSFSCTGPVVGWILIDAAQGAVLEPMVGMFGFSLAFAIPFTLFAIFPSLLKKMPQSGGWLNSVKVVLGFIELALALKFLSIADQTYHWGLLDRHIYIAIWIVIFGLMGMYLLGKIKFSHDSDMPFLKVPRLMFSILVFSFVIYLIPGLFGSPLKLLAGYLPPMSTHEFNLLGAINGEEGITCKEEPKYSGFLHLPHGIKGYFDYDEAIECAKSQDKPLFIDFTGHGCVNCRKMEASVWSDPRVLKLLKEEFVVVALYCDDKKQLPENERYKSKFDGKTKKTIGSKNLDFQICTFGNNAQPLYVLLDNEEELCSPYIGSEFDADIFYKHLKDGLAVFNKRNLTK